MAENMPAGGGEEDELGKFLRRMEEEGKREKTPEEILEAELYIGFANYPLTPDEIERMIRKLESGGIKPDVGKVVRRVLKCHVATGPSADREIASLIVFCKLHDIPYEEDYDAEQLREIERISNYQVKGWMDLYSKK